MSLNFPQLLNSLFKHHDASEVFHYGFIKICPQNHIEYDFQCIGVGWVIKNY